MRDNVIDATILTSSATSKITFIPRNPMVPTDLPFEFNKVSLPINV